MPAFADRALGYFFAPQSPVNLGICRAIFFTVFFWYYSSLPLYLWGDIAPELWKPIWFFKKFGIGPLPSTVLLPAYYLWLVAMLLAAIGLYTRVSTVVSFVIGGYLVCLSQCWGKVSHDDAVVIITMGILACSRCGDAFSIDAGLRKTQPEPRGEYRWPIRAVWVALSLAFFAAGVANLRMSGLEWAWSDNLLYTTLRRQYISPNLNETAILLGQVWWLPRLMAASTLFFEVGYPLALFSRRLRYIFVPGLIVSVLAFKFMISPDFRQLIYLSLFWIPWTWLIAKLQARIEVSRPVILYDGLCTLCRHSRRWVSLLDPAQTVEWLPLQDPRAASYGVPRQVLEDQMGAVYRNRTYLGFLAWKLILRRHPFFWLIVTLTAALNPWLLALWVLFFLPVTEPIGHRVYRWVSANRFRLPGSTCKVTLEDESEKSTGSMRS